VYGAPSGSISPRIAGVAGLPTSIVVKTDRRVTGLTGPGWSVWSNPVPLGPYRSRPHWSSWRV